MHVLKGVGLLCTTCVLVHDSVNHSFLGSKAPSVELYVMHMSKQFGSDYPLRVV